MIESSFIYLSLTGDEKVKSSAIDKHKGDSELKRVYSESLNAYRELQRRLLGHDDKEIDRMHWQRLCRNPDTSGDDVLLMTDLRLRLLHDYYRAYLENLPEVSQHKGKWLLLTEPDVRNPQYFSTADNASDHEPAVRPVPFVAFIIEVGADDQRSRESGVFHDATVNELLLLPDGITPPSTLASRSITDHKLPIFKDWHFKLWPDELEQPPLIVDCVGYDTGNPYHMLFTKKVMAASVYLTNVSYKSWFTIQDRSKARVITKKFRPLLPDFKDTSGNGCMVLIGPELTKELEIAVFGDHYGIFHLFSTESPHYKHLSNAIGNGASLMSHPSTTRDEKYQGLEVHCLPLFDNLLQHQHNVDEWKALCCVGFDTGCRAPMLFADNAHKLCFPNGSKFNYKCVVKGSTAVQLQYDASEYPPKLPTNSDITATGDLVLLGIDFLAMSKLAVFGDISGKFYFLSTSSDTYTVMMELLNDSDDKHSSGSVTTVSSVTTTEEEDECEETTSKL